VNIRQALELFAIGLVAAVVPQTGSAQFVPGSDITLSYVGWVGSPWDINYTQNGVFPGTVTGGAPFEFQYPYDAPLDSVFTFCSEPLGPLPNPVANITYTVQTLADYSLGAGADVNARTFLERLYGHVFGSVAGYHPESLSATERGGFQFAVWEIMNDPTVYNMGSGNFFLNASQPSTYSAVINAAIVQANSYLSAVTGAYTGPSLDLLVLESDSAQDQILVIPEPGTYAAILAGVSLLAVMLIRIRRRVSI